MLYVNKMIGRLLKKQAAETSPVLQQQSSVGSDARDESPCLDRRMAALNRSRRYVDASSASASPVPMFFPRVGATGPRGATGPPGPPAVASLSALRAIASDIPIISSGLYTPSSTYSSRLSGISHDTSNYTRIGDSVSVRSIWNMNVTSPTGLVFFEFTVPVDSTHDSGSFVGHAQVIGNGCTSRGATVLVESADLDGPNAIATLHNAATGPHEVKLGFTYLLSQ